MTIKDRVNALNQNLKITIEKHPKILIPYKRYGYEEKNKYFLIYSILSNNQHCAVEFVDKKTLDIFKAKSWRRKGRYIGNLSTLLNIF